MDEFAVYPSESAEINRKSQRAIQASAEMINMREYLEYKFLHMRPSEQRFINAARDERIFWRGESIEDFKRIYEETQRMRQIGPQAYPVEAMGKLKALVGKMKRPSGRYCEIP